MWLRVLVLIAGLALTGIATAYGRGDAAKAFGYAFFSLGVYALGWTLLRAFEELAEARSTARHRMPYGGRR